MRPHKHINVQTKAVVLDAAVAALATLERELQGLLPSQALLYVEARRLIRAFYHSQGQGQQQQPLAPSPRPSPTPALSLGALEASPLLLAPLLPDILALGCHAAAAAGAQGGQQQAPSALSSQAEEEGEGHGASAVVASAEAVPELQLKGVQVLGTLVRLFAGVPDPDAPPEEQEEQEAGGRPPSVLAQYTSQVTAALAPVLANPLSPALVEAGCGLFFAGLRAGEYTWWASGHTCIHVDWITRSHTITSIHPFIRTYAHESSHRAAGRCHRAQAPPRPPASLASAFLLRAPPRPLPRPERRRR